MEKLFILFYKFKQLNIKLIFFLEKYLISFTLILNYLKLKK